jgi:hypothetical protein
VGVALKTTPEPEQIVVAEAAMLTLAGNKGLTVMVIEFEVAGLPETQMALEVITQVITSLLTNELLV